MAAKEMKPDDIVRQAKARSMLWVNDGFDSPLNRLRLKACTFAHEPSGTMLIYTRDGQYKNYIAPDYQRVYEQCYHLVLCFFDAARNRWLPHNHDRALWWCRKFFGEHTPAIWVEPPNRDAASQRDVWHYRLLCTYPDWRPTHTIDPAAPGFYQVTRGWMSMPDLQAYRTTTQHAQGG